MSKKESVFYKAAKETMVEYFQKTSLNGFGLLYNIRRRKYQRLLWFMFILMGISFATYVVLFTLIYFLEDPTVTSLVAQRYEIWNVPFPAIAVCSVNKLSHRAVAEYAEELSRLSFPYKHREYWLEKLHLFVGFFDSDSVDFDEAMELQNELDDMQNDNFNTSHILRRLSPNCDFLLVCRLAGLVKDCNAIFKLQATAAGYCCIFNYQRGSDYARSFPLFYPNGTVIETGALSLLLNTSSNSDYFYADRNIRGGCTLQIFGQNFPDASTGNLHELFVSPGDDIEVHLSLVVQTTTTEARNYPYQKRHCFFSDEHVEYGLAYNQAECLARCKIRSVLNQCGCVPFYTPIDLVDWNTSSVVYCSLAHIDCMERNRVTWNTYGSMDAGISIPLHFQQEQLQDALECKNCLPLCSYSRYSYRKRVTKLRETQHLAENKILLANSTSLCEDCSVVKLYFPTPYAVQYRKNVLFNWYQILSNIGGVIGICMGCSFISGFEIIYFAGFRLFENFNKYRKIK